MGRTPCCDKVGLKKGPWTPEEDQKLLAYIEEHGHGSWRALPTKAGLQRCGKSCRLRWTNYLRPDIKRGKFSLQEEQTIIQLHALLGNRWSAIATHLPKRTDNEIKNYWNTHLKKRLTKMGIDPVTHKPKNDTLLSNNGPSKTAANLSHMAQWESARLEAEARLVRQSKLRTTTSFHLAAAAAEFSSPASTPLNKTVAPLTPPRCLDILKAWGGPPGGDLESPTSTLSYSENGPPAAAAAGIGESSTAFFEFVGNSGSSEGVILKEEREEWKGMESSNNLGIETPMFMEGPWTPESLRTGNSGENLFMEKFTDLLLNNSGDQSLSGDSDSGGDGSTPSGSDDCIEDNKNYWNSILNLVNSSPSESPMF